MSDTKETKGEGGGGCCDPATMKKMFEGMQKGGGFSGCAEMMKNMGQGCCGPMAEATGEKDEK